MRKRLGILAVLGVAGMAVALGAVESRLPPRPSPSHLREAVKGADRVVVVQQEVSVGDRVVNGPPVEVGGAEAAQDLLDRLEWEATFMPPGVRRTVRCACDGDFRIEFYQGDRLLGSLGYHHNELLRWRDGPWDTDVKLTEKAKQEVPAWFTAHGFPAMEEFYARRIQQVNPPTNAPRR